VLTKRTEKRAVIAEQNGLSDNELWQGRMKQMGE
jgi:hypothetical protein